MKILIATLSVLFLNRSVATAQINVRMDSTFVKTAGSKTYFLYRDSDTASLDELTRLINQNWSYNTIEFKSIKGFDPETVNVNDLVFSITYNYKIVQSVYWPSNSYIYRVSMGEDNHYPDSHFVDFFLTLSQKKDSGYVIVSQSNLSVSGPTLRDVVRTNKRPEDIIHDQYHSRVVFSWNYPYLGTIMNSVSTALEDGVRFDSGLNKNTGLSDLKKKTLYVSDAIEVARNRFSGKEKIVRQRKRIDKAYDYNFEIVSTKKLNEIAATGKKDYVLMYQRVGRGKVLLVIDVAAMQIVYEKFVIGKYKFKKKDIKKLNKLLSRLN